MTDDFSHFSESLTAPATAAEAIVPDDVTELAFVTRALYVGQGDAQVRLRSGDIVVLRNLQAGVIYPLGVTQVLAAGTSATDLVGLR